MRNEDLHSVYGSTNITGIMSSGIPEGHSGAWRKKCRTFSRQGDSSQSRQLITQRYGVTKRRLES